MNLFAKFVAVVSLAFVFTETAVTATDTPKEAIASFFDLVENNKVEEAVQTYMSPQIMVMMGAQMQSTIGQIAGLNAALGKSQGYEKVFSEVITGRSEHHVYMMYFEGMPIVYSFYLYQTGGRWLISSFSFNTDYESLDRIMQN